MYVVAFSVLVADIQNHDPPSFATSDGSLSVTHSKSAVAQSRLYAKCRKSNKSDGNQHSQNPMITHIFPPFFSPIQKNQNGGGKALVERKDCINHRAVQWCRCLFFQVNRLAGGVKPCKPFSHLGAKVSHEHEGEGTVNQIQK
jgi:hypothetical protein